MSSSRKWYWASRNVHPLVGKQHIQLGMEALLKKHHKVNINEKFFAGPPTIFDPLTRRPIEIRLKSPFFWQKIDPRPAF